MMELGHVSVASMGGMVFSILIAFGLPVGLSIFLGAKKKARIMPLFVGGLTFFVFALILESIFHSLVFAVTGSVLKNNILLYAIYGGLAAALFEECGRFLAMKWVTKKRQNPADALMYGVGHGGVEMIVIVGVTNFMNLIASMSINAGVFASVFGRTAANEETAVMSSVLEAVSKLWTTPSWQFYMAGIERILAMILQISFSVLVYHAVVDKKKKYLFLAGFFHFAVDAVTVLIASKVSILGVEAVVAMMAAGVAWYTYQILHSM